MQLSAGEAHIFILHVQVPHQQTAGTLNRVNKLSPDLEFHDPAPAQPCQTRTDTFLRASRRKIPVVRSDPMEKEAKRPLVEGAEHYKEAGLFPSSILKF